MKCSKRSFDVRAAPSGRGICRPHPQGEKPSDMPLQAPTKYELIVNLKTANALGLSLPESILATADEVID
jgi:hypothetical protein